MLGTRSTTMPQSNAVTRYIFENLFYMNPLAGSGRAGNQGKVYLKGIQRYKEIEETMSMASAPSDLKQPCIHTENLS